MSKLSNSEMIEEYLKTHEPVKCPTVNASQTQQIRCKTDVLRSDREYAKKSYYRFNENTNEFHHSQKHKESKNRNMKNFNLNDFLRESVK